LGKESVRSRSNNWVSWRLREILMVGFDGLYTQGMVEGAAGGILADADAGRKSKGQSCTLFMTTVGLAQL
jgi:hypothetical protein